jgi:hypothetical protein
LPTWFDREPGEEQVPVTGLRFFNVFSADSPIKLIQVDAIDCLAFAQPVFVNRQRVLTIIPVRR